MATDGPSWADQWGAGGIGAIPEDENPERGVKKEGQATNSTALGKAKAAVAVGGHKVINGMSRGIKWFKHQFHRKGSTK